MNVRIFSSAKYFIVFGQKKNELELQNILCVCEMLDRGLAPLNLQLQLEFFANDFSVKSEVTSILLFIDFFVCVSLLWVQHNLQRWNKWTAPDSKCAALSTHKRTQLETYAKTLIVVSHSVSLPESWAIRANVRGVCHPTNSPIHKCQIWTTTLDFGTRC